MALDSMDGMGDAMEQPAYATLTPGPGNTGDGTDTQTLIASDSRYTADDVFGPMTCTLREDDARLGPLPVTLTFDNRGLVKTVLGLPRPLPAPFVVKTAAALFLGTVNGRTYDSVVIVTLSDGTADTGGDAGGGDGGGSSAPIRRICISAGSPLTECGLFASADGVLSWRVYLPVTLKDEDAGAGITLSDITQVTKLEMGLSSSSAPPGAWTPAAAYAEAAGQAGAFVGTALPAVRGAYWLWVRVSFAGGGQVEARGRDVLIVG